MGRTNCVAGERENTLKVGVSRSGLLLVGFSLAGIAVSAYLTYEHYRGGQYFCGGVGDCDFVNSSAYATLAGLPVALFGLLAYVGILAASSAIVVRPLHAVNATLALFGLALVGVLFSAYLTYVELFILHAI